MTKKAKPTKADKRISEALDLISQLGLPHEQRNERSALTLLALLGLKPGERWTQAKNPLIGITPMMEFFAAHYGRRYAPNTRETVRRYSVHQFVDAGLVIKNPDDSSRPTNSPDVVYQIHEGVLKLIRKFGGSDWKRSLAKFISSGKTLLETYNPERKMNEIPIKLPADKKINLSPGPHNLLSKAILEKFCPRYAPGCMPVYIGDTAKKIAHRDDRLFEKLCIKIDPHGKMPDIILFVEKKKWLILVEAVTSHGPVNPKRKRELEKLFKGCKAKLVYVTAFNDRATMVKYLRDISWETDVWIADSPSHLIHFDGEKFLGPYSS